MAWEWVPPAAAGASGIVGVFFTWLAGAQGRAHAETMVHETQIAAERSNLHNERRNAYLQAVRLCDVHLRLMRYEREGRTARLGELRAAWPDIELQKQRVDVLVAVRTFGSPSMRELLEDYCAANDEDDESKMREIHERAVAQVRREINVDLEPEDR